METDHAKEQAEAQLASIKEMVWRLNHVERCNGPDDACYRDVATKPVYESPAERDKAIEEYHDEDESREAITQDALEVSVRSNWAPSSDEWEAESYKILLCFGGPSVRITGKLDEYNQPQTAQLEHQDWGTPWTRLPLTLEDIDALLTYAGCFYFGK